MKRRLLMKLMNAEKMMRNLSEFSVAENLDDESPMHTFLLDLEGEADAMADKLSELHEMANELKEG